MRSFLLCVSVIGLKSKKKDRNGVPYQSQIDEDERGQVESDAKREPATASIATEVQFGILQRQQNNEYRWCQPESLSLKTQHCHHEIAEDNVYKFCHEKRGFAVLIINSEFVGQPKRESAENDIENMKEMFSKLRFDVELLQNLSSSDLLLKLNGK
jgi:hypothetical protein